MAKWERNRIMFFGAQSLSNIAAEATAEFDSEDIASVTVAAATFSTAVSGVSGEYTFICTAAASGGDPAVWTLNTATASLTTYGITITLESEGAVAVGDAITVYFSAASSPWEAIGKDNDDLSKELNPQTETTANVLGEVTFTHSGYEPEVSVDPYYIDPGRKLYKWIRDIAQNEKYAEKECVGYFAECMFTHANKERQIMIGTANVRKAWFIPQSVGGDTGGAAVPINIQPFGAVTKYEVSYDMATNEPTFTSVS